jgi:RNA polymerase sigma factor (sigma-70 family)
MRDSELLAKYVSGARRASECFGEIVRRHADMVYSTCLRILGDSHLAEDAAQAVFLVLARKASSISPKRSLAGWLYQTAQHAAMDARKRAARRARHEKEAAAMRPRPAREADWSSVAPHLDLALAALPARHRDALVLHYLEGKTQVQVASELGCDQSTVSKRLSGGLDRLRRQLARCGITVSSAALGSALAANAIASAPPQLVAVAQAILIGGGEASSISAAIAEGTTKAMTYAKIKLAGAVLAATTAAVAGGGFTAHSILAGEPVKLPEKLKSAPPNTWVKVLEAKSGGRDQPVFVYASKLKRFIAAAGMQHYGGVKPRHYDTEEFDLEKLKWFNAYPPGTEKGRPESGPVGPEYAKQRAKCGYNGRRLMYKDGDYTRLGAGGQWHNGKTYGEYCYVPDKGKAGTVYVYMWQKHTLAYDAAGRTWTDTKAPARTKAKIWGSICYDPVNKEIVHAGGGSGSAETSTWVYSLEKNEWRELPMGSEPFKKLWEESKKLRWEAKKLLGRCSSRHQVAETAGEAEVDLVAEAKKLAAAAEKLAAEVKAAKVEANEKAGAGVAVKRLEKAVAAVRAAGPKLSGKITPEKIAEVRAARAIFLRVVDALSLEPPGRARSPIAYDEANKKVVLFGGDGLDRALSDTWVYDVKTRKWEQRFPKKCPAPRAGHLLGYLPAAKKIVVAGGYSRVPLAHEIWSYDVGADAWKLLKHVPLGGGRRPASPGCPNTDARHYLTGTVGPGDTLFCFQGNTVWGCRADPSQGDAGTAAKGVEPGTYAWNRISPAGWEKQANPTPEQTSAFIKGLPVNQWTAFKFPKYAPGARNRWGTSAYDTDRHQFMLWGGGHATSHENDVGHFSVRAGFWTIGFHPDDPIERVYASQPTALSFSDRPHVPVHSYRAYSYCPASKKMFYGNRAYDPLVREWEPKAYPGLSWRGVMKSHLSPTPKGVVCFSSHGLFRFDAEAKKWVKLPWKGTRKGGWGGGAWCDGPAMVYDSKRDCLWMAYKTEIYKYIFATGAAEKLTPKRPAALGKSYLFQYEAEYVPEADLIVTMVLVNREGHGVGNYAWDPNDGKFYGMDLKFVEGGKEVKFKRNIFNHSDALAYDPKLKLLLINNSSRRKVWVAKLDAKKAKLKELK